MPGFHVSDHLSSETVAFKKWPRQCINRHGPAPGIAPAEVGAADAKPQQKKRRRRAPLL
jgi:hypothetical protein